MDFAVKIVLAYLCGSVIGALWVGRVLGHGVIRKMGSGNAGGTNALRTQGWFFALLVVVIDVGKGSLAAAWVPGLSLPFAAASGSAWLAVSCAAAAVAGHVFPLYHGFRGGKGAATLVGALAFINWQVLVVVLATWLVIVGLTGYVGLATMSAVAVAAVAGGLLVGFSSPLFAFMAAMSAFIVFTHRGNIARMRAHKENRMRQLMLFKGSEQGDDAS